VPAQAHSPITVVGFGGSGRQRPPFMPSKSKSQARFMRACAESASFRRKAKCPPKKVAKEYVRADQRRKK